MASIKELLSTVRKGQLNDQVIAHNMMIAAKGGASAYLMAFFQAVNPDLKRLLLEYVTQTARTHNDITNVAVESGGFSPYAAPEAQLSEWYEASRKALSPPQ